MDVQLVGKYIIHPCIPAEIPKTSTGPTQAPNNRCAAKSPLRSPNRHPTRRAKPERVRGGTALTFGGVGRVPGNGRSYPIYALSLVSCARPHFSDSR